MSDPPLMPLRRVDGYLPLEDHGLIGDGSTAALVGRDGSVAWMCVPKFDSPPLFCGLLDARRGGALEVAPVEILESAQLYESDTAVLRTTLRSAEGLLEITDACLLQPGADLAEDVPADRGELLRSLRVLKGRVPVRVIVRPYGGGELEPRGGGYRIRTPERPDLDLQLRASRPLEGAETVWHLGEGDAAHVLLGWKEGRFHHRSAEPAAQLEETRQAWRRWMQHVSYEGPEAALIRRSAITLKLLDCFESGAMVAAPTASLPEWIGGSGNWDYRYTWIRDAAFSVHALRRIGMGREAAGFLGWVLDVVEGRDRPCVMYSLDGSEVPPEREDPVLEGYRRTRPVRWGNAAARQHQHDVFGEILDCAYQWVGQGGRIEPHTWERLRPMVASARREWGQPDHGIWEVRTEPRPFTYSAALCQVAVDRAAAIAEKTGLPGEVGAWQAEAASMRDAILRRAWDPRRRAFLEHLDGGDLDASVLALPLRRVVAARDPRMAATIETVSRELSAGDGLLFRHDPDRPLDGTTPRRQGAFLVCSFWLVDNRILQGRLDEALELFRSLCGRASPLGLLPEQLHPSSGSFLGNFPLAISHVGLIASGVHLAREMRKG